MNKRTIPQSVFDSPEAQRIAKQAHREACKELARTPRHKLDPGNPNHPDYDHRIFGYAVPDLLAKQYR